MSHCDEILDHIYEYLNRHDISADQEAEFMRHLEYCRACFDRFEFERRLLERLKASQGCACPDSLKRRIKTIVEKFG